MQYDLLGTLQHSYTIAGSDDGVKVDPATGDVWVLQNQDGNSTLSFIDPATNQVSAPLSYTAPYIYGADSTRGYDDAAFIGQKVFLSYTNPVNPGDAVIQRLTNGTAPFGSLQTTDVLRLGDTGTNLATGELNQPLPLSDPELAEVAARRLADSQQRLGQDVHDRRQSRHDAAERELFYAALRLTRRRHHADRDIGHVLRLQPNR